MRVRKPPIWLQIAVCLLGAAVAEGLTSCSAGPISTRIPSGDFRVIRATDHGTPLEWITRAHAAVFTFTPLADSMIGVGIAFECGGESSTFTIQGASMQPIPNHDFVDSVGCAWMDDADRPIEPLQLPANTLSSPMRYRWLSESELILTVSALTLTLAANE